MGASVEFELQMNKQHATINMPPLLLRCRLLWFCFLLNLSGDISRTQKGQGAVVLILHIRRLRAQRSARMLGTGHSLELSPPVTLNYMQGTCPHLVRGVPPSGCLEMTSCLEGQYDGDLLSPALYSVSMPLPITIPGNGYSQGHISTGHLREEAGWKWPWPETAVSKNP